MMLKWLVTAVIVYGGSVALLYLAQRLFQYFPERRRTAPSAVGLTKAEEVVLDTADGERVIVWHVPPCGGQPVFVYFHGNGGSLRWREERFRDLIADGSGLVALSYRGYGGSSGYPTEKGLIEDAKAAYAFSAARYPAERLVLWGESLGSALALSLAAENPVGRVVLEAPFTSAVDVGAQHYWFVPVRLLMKDRFRLDLRASKVTAPVLVVHGENDMVVPITLGERLYGLVQAPKRFVRVAGSGHNDLGTFAVARAKQFIAEQFPANQLPTPLSIEPQGQFKGEQGWARTYELSRRRQTQIDKRCWRTPNRAARDQGKLGNVPLSPPNDTGSR